MLLCDVPLATARCIYICKSFEMALIFWVDMAAQTLMAIASAAIVLRFDGSLRSNPSSGGAIAASCAAAVLQNDDKAVLAVGGRSLSTDVVPGLTSGEAEYSGLILGLEYISNALVLGQADDSAIRIEHLWRQEINKHGDVESAAAATLTIRGDCKTVIDHCQGCAVPRKLRPKYDMTMEQIECIRDYMRGALGRELQLSFEHVKRENNELCDAMCKLITSRKEEDIVSKIEREIDEAGIIAASSMVVLPKAAKKRRKCRESPFAHPLKQISGASSGTVSIPKRLELYKHLARAVLESKDAVAMRLLGDVLRYEESKVIAISCHSGDDIYTIALLFELSGLRQMKLLEDAERFERKHRHILRQYAGSELDSIAAFGQDPSSVALHGDKAEKILVPIDTIDASNNLVKDWYRQINSENMETGVWVSQGGESPAGAIE